VISRVILSAAWPRSHPVSLVDISSNSQMQIHFSSPVVVPGDLQDGGPLDKSGPTNTDASGMICRTICRTIMFSQVGFPTINNHPRPDPVPSLVRYLHHRLRFGQWATIWAMSWHSPHRPRSARGSQENETE
jgi:hypothetical protein